MNQRSNAVLMDSTDEWMDRYLQGMINSKEVTERKYIITYSMYMYSYMYLLLIKDRY
jgi:hypothetical protein